MLLGGVRRLVGVAVLALGGGALWAVAPALSSSPYVPQAVDFEQPLAGAVKRVAPVTAPSPRRSAGPGHDAADHGPVRFRTEPIRAPRRFDVVGVAGVTAHLEFRTRREDEAWSEWVETTDGNPVWAGGHDFVQVRSRSARIAGHLHYVNVTGTDGPLRRILTGVRSAVSSVVTNALGTDRAEAARALRYVPRSAWGADRTKGGCPPRVEPSLGSVKLAAIHHTVTTNTYPPEAGPGVVLGICRYHRNANGWNDIGYNALVDRHGVLYEGRAGGINRAVIGAHAGDWNSRVSGVALIGNHVSARPAGKAVKKLVKYLAWKLNHHGIERSTGKRRIRSSGGSLNRFPKGKRPRLNYVLTHRHLNATSCAGDATEALLRKIRKRIQRKLNRWDGRGPKILPTEGEPPPEPEPEPDPEEDPGSDGSSGGTPTGGAAWRG